jgi:hypothetical protein
MDVIRHDVGQGMAFFQVRLHGKRINVPSGDGSIPITGFVTTRFVAAVSPDKASEKAKSIVLKDWTSGSYAAVNRGSAPELSIDAVSKASLFKWLTARNTGHTFYATEKDA